MKKRTIYIGLSLIFIIGIVSLIGTFAIDSTITEGNSSVADYLFNIVLGDRTNRQIVIPSYDSKIVDVRITNPNTFDMSYLLYLEGTNSNISVVNISDTDSSGILTSKSTSTMKIFVQNNSSSDITIKINDLVGFETETLSLPSNSTGINKDAYYKAVVKSNDNSYGKIKPNIKLSAKSGTVKYQIVPNDGYRYKSNTCGGTVSNNILTITNVSSNISCQVVFEAKTVTVSLDMEGGAIESFYNTVQQHTYTVPYTGSYKIEAWGASGNNDYNSYTKANPSYAGYTSGVISLSKGESLYLYVGGQGKTFNCCTTQGSNAGSGGASDVRLVSGTWDDTASLASRIMVAGGAGGTYSDASAPGGGSAGGLTSYSTSNSRVTVASSTQVAGGAAGLNGNAGGFGYGGSHLQSVYNSGAGGYYGGGSGPSGGGGTSYISGHTGCVAITSQSSITPKSGCTTGTSDNSCSLHYSGKKFTDTVMIDGLGYSWTNTKGSLTQMPSPDGGYYESGIGNSGNGAIRITYSDDINYTVTYTEGYGILPTPTKRGYIFDGWYTEPDGKGTLATNGSGLVSDVDHTLYAKWKKGCSIPMFSYTGDYQVVDDNDYVINNVYSYTGNWKIKFLSSGTLTFSTLDCAVDGIDAFIVGGGGNGAAGTPYIGHSSGGGGGGGGSAITVSRLSVSTETSYSITVGAAVENSSFGTSSTAYFTALAGSTGPAATFENTTGYSTTAGIGGTGRLSTETSNYGAIGVTVKNGSDGDGIDGNYEFNEEGNKRYGAGGGFGTQGVSTGSGGTALVGKDGGADGGGQGGQGCSYDTRSGNGYATYGADAGSAGTANSGSGGGGGGGACGSGTSSYGFVGAGGAGGTGIVIIRNTRTNETNPPVGTITATKNYNTINTSISATDDTGIDHYEYYLSTSSTCPTTGYISSNSNTYSFEVTNTGTYYVCARVVDLIGNALSLKSNALSFTRVYKVAIRYNTNGGTITSSAGGYTWTTNSSGLIYQNGSVYEQTLYYGKTIDLANYNNSSFINISVGDAYVVSGSEWVCLSGCSNVGKIYNQDVKYSTSDFCDLTSSNCTVVLGLRIVEDITPPTCTISANSTTITAVPADDKGVAKLSYYGWDSTFSGSNSTTKAISAGTHTYYVKDGSGNTASCSISIESTVDGCIDGYWLNNAGDQCYYSYYAVPSYKVDGYCTCKNSTSGLASQGGCLLSGGALVCNCPSGAYTTGNYCTKTITSYSCNSGGQQIGGACYFYSDVIQVCPSEYSAISDSNFCYK